MPSSQSTCATSFGYSKNFPSVIPREVVRRMQISRILSAAGFAMLICINGISADTMDSQTGENNTVALNMTVCPGIPKRYYDELGCQPVFQAPEDLCPVRYTCEKFENADADMCHFRGEAYSPGSMLNDTGNPCDIDCFCDLDEASPEYNITKMAVFRCAEVDCPLEELGSFDENGDPRKCVPKKSHDVCCASETVCADGEEEDVPNSKSIDTENESPKNQSQTLAKCVTAENSTYVEGQEFYLDEAPCKVCICQPGYTAGETGEPWCRDLRCSTLLGHTREVRTGCVPVYFGDKSCCPIEFRCPNANDTVISDVLVKIAPHPDETCKFGDLFLRIGDRLAPNADSKCVECECQIPPYVTCRMKSNC